MSLPRRARLLGPAAVVAAFVGLWVSHTLVYLTLGGRRGFASALVGSVHLYMLPLGLALAVAAALTGARAWRAWTALGTRMAEARAALALAWRGGARPAARPVAWRALAPSPGERPGAGTAAGAALAAAWLGLTATQVALYLFQENAEAGIAGLRLPLLQPVSGARSVALLVHAAVALGLALGLTWIARRIARREGRLEACERLVRAVLGRLRAAAGVPARRPRPAAPPLAIFGRQLWRRPPPLPLSAVQS